jgi:hypothetical protein
MGYCCVVFMRCFCFIIHRFKIYKRLKLLNFIYSYMLAILLIALPPLAYVYFYKGLGLVPQFWTMFLMYAILTFSVCFATLLSHLKNAELSTKVFLVGTIIKLLVCMFFVPVYLSQYHVNQLHFLLCYFYLYLLNTVFEIYTLLCNLRLQNLK